MSIEKTTKNDLYPIDPILIRAGKEFMEKMPEYPYSEKIFKIIKDKKKK